MRYIKALYLTALAITAFATMGATARAETTVLPLVLLAESAKTNTLIAASATAKTDFTGIVNIEGEGYKFELNQTEPTTGLGKGLLTFLKAKLLGKACKSSLDVAGTVLVQVEWHTVLALGGGAKLFIILILVTPSLTVECEGTTVVVTGSQGLNTEPFGKAVAKTGLLSAETGKKCPYNVYTNDSNEMITGGLKSETGGLKAASCQEVEGVQIYSTEHELTVV